MDKNGRLFGKISIIDMFVVLLIAAIVTGVVFRFGFSGSVARNDETAFRYTIQFRRVREFTRDYHRAGIGTVVYERFSNNPVGVVYQVTYSQFYEVHRMPDGSVVELELPGFKNIYVTIDTRGFIDDRGAFFTEESFELRVGRNIALWFRYVNVTGVVIDIEVME